jgi:hypothetical protein
MKRKMLIAICSLMLLSRQSLADSVCTRGAVSVSGYCAISLIAILSNAEKFFGKKIETEGYLSADAYGDALVLTKDDVAYAVSYSGLLLETLDKELAKNHNGRKIRVRGILIEREKLTTPIGAYYLKIERVMPVIKYED